MPNKSGRMVPKYDDDSVMSPEYEFLEPVLSAAEVASIPSTLEDLTMENELEEIDHDALILSDSREREADKRLQAELIRETLHDRKSELKLQAQRDAMEAFAEPDQVKALIQGRETASNRVIGESLRKIEEIENDHTDSSMAQRDVVMTMFHEQVATLAKIVPYREAFDRVTEAFISFSSELTQE